MTNREKFEEMFQPITDQPLQGCLVCPDDVCEACRDCKDCPYYDWWEHEYKEEKKTMTRTEAELAIVEKLGEIRKIYEEFAPENAPYLTMTLGKATPEQEEEGLWHGWRGSVTAFKVMDDERIEYLLNASVFDGELFHHDDGTIIEGVTI